MASVIMSHIGSLDTPNASFNERGVRNHATLTEKVLNIKAAVLQMLKNENKLKIN